MYALTVKKIIFGFPKLIISAMIVIILAKNVKEVGKKIAQNV